MSNVFLSTHYADSSSLNSLFPFTSQTSQSTQQVPRHHFRLLNILLSLAQINLACPSVPTNLNAASVISLGPERTHSTAAILTSDKSQGTSVLLAFSLAHQIECIRTIGKILI